MDAQSCICSFVDDGSVESHRYFLARRTVLEMLRDRGYAVAPADLELTLPEFRSIYGQIPDVDRLLISTSLISNPIQKIRVIFCGPEMVKLATIRTILDQIRNENLHRLILVLQNKITSQAKKATKELFPCKVELFQITDLLVNITKHVLKPKHEILNPEEKKKLLSKYSAEEKQLPRMLESDAVARYYGLEPGQGAIHAISFLRPNNMAVANERHSKHYRRRHDAFSYPSPGTDVGRTTLNLCTILANTATPHSCGGNLKDTDMAYDPLRKVMPQGPQTKAKYQTYAENNIRELEGKKKWAWVGWKERSGRASRRSPDPRGWLSCARRHVPVTCDNRPGWREGRQGQNNCRRRFVATGENKSLFWYISSSGALESVPAEFCPFEIEMASQAHLEKMQLRQSYRNLWHTDLMSTISADFPYTYAVLDICHVVGGVVRVIALNFVSALRYGLPMLLYDASDRRMR
ncbi:hypothetical protein ACLOJK_032269 [Asimina triloba]